VGVEPEIQHTSMRLGERVGLRDLNFPSDQSQDESDGECSPEDDRDLGGIDPLPQPYQLTTSLSPFSLYLPPSAVVPESIGTESE